MMPVPDMAVIRIPYVKVYTDRYRQGAALLSQAGPQSRGRSPECPGRPSSWRRIRLRSAKRPTPASRQGPGTVGALICDYLKSPAFTDLAASSKALYRTILDKFGTLHGHRMVHDMPRSKIASYVYAIGAIHPAMANVTKAVLRKLLAHAVRDRISE